MAEKMSQKELKKPDAFQKAGIEASGWLADHGKLVLIAILLAFFGGAGVALANFMSSREEAQAARALGLSLAILEKPIEGQGTPEPGVVPYKTEKERDEAAATSLAEFRKQYPQSRSATTAALALAQAQMRLGKPEEALLAFDEYLKAAPIDDPLRSTALEGKGYALESKGQLDEAIAAFDQLAGENRAEFLNGMGLYHRSRILIQQGKKDEAAKQLSEIPAAAPNSAAARLATDRMAVLTAEGINVPPPAAPSQPDAG